MNSMRLTLLNQRRDLIALFGLSTVWLIAVVIANPLGDFPLNDDWSMGLTVKRLIEEGSYHPTGWTSMPLVSQALWGALFCTPKGFSFTALRTSTLTLSLAGTLGMYGLLRQMQCTVSLALLGAFTLCLNPVYFALSNTFMTDVPFTAMIVFATWFFLRYLQTEFEFDYWLGILFALAEPVNDYETAVDRN